MKLRNLLIQLGRQYPQKLACSFDYVGHQTGKVDLDKDIHKIFLCLDFSEFCLPEVNSFRPDIVLTHHPFFFGDKNKIRQDDSKKAQLEKEFLSLGCPLYSFHTNFDKADRGMNTTLLSYLGFTDSFLLEDGMTRFVPLKKETEMKDILSLLLNKFPFEILPFYDFGHKIKNFAFLAGGGGNEFKLALKHHADLYISGDISHHARLDLYRYQMDYIELPHECEETGFLIGMNDFLSSLDKSLQILPFSYEKYFSIAYKKEIS